MPSSKSRDRIKKKRGRFSSFMDGLEFVRVVIELLFGAGRLIGAGLRVIFRFLE